jgi:RHS repeat-associated protein
VKMQHIPASGGWTRHYEYATNGNRLLATSIPSDDPQGPYSHTYSYDEHGSMTAMPHLSSMVWNHDDELQEVTAGTETVYFQYAGGIRSRKYTEKSGSTTEERIYLGAFEIYRKRINGDLDLERESLHISDGSGRICIIETKTVEDEDPVSSPEGIWRYQHGNHLGSAATELTQDGDIISYEEYHPYGTSAYRAVDSSIDVSPKRYRYTGMERDEETGLAYHSARYLVPWLGRWTAADPIGLRGGANRYMYVRGAPAVSADKSGTTDEQYIDGGETIEITIEGPSDIHGTVDYLAENPNEIALILGSSGWSYDAKNTIARGLLMRGFADVAPASLLARAGYGYLGYLDAAIGSPIRWWWGNVDDTIRGALQTTDDLIRAANEGTFLLEAGETFVLKPLEATADNAMIVYETPGDMADRLSEGDVIGAAAEWLEGARANWDNVALAVGLLEGLHVLRGGVNAASVKGDGLPPPPPKKHSSQSPNRSGPYRGAAP